MKTIEQIMEMLAKGLERQWGLGIARLDDSETSTTYSLSDSTGTLAIIGLVHGQIAVTATYLLDERPDLKHHLLWMVGTILE